MDSSPFYGGDEILSYYATGIDRYNVTLCTTAFDVYDHLHKWNAMLTAGHCEENNKLTSWYSGYISGQSLYLGPLEGVVGSRKEQNKGSDVMAITLRKKTGTYSPYVFVGSATSSFSYSLVGTYALKTGEIICTDGFTSGAQICRPKITHLNMCVIFTGEGPAITICHLAEATYSKPFCIPGDSGGPVYNAALTMARVVEALGTIDGMTRHQDNCFFNEIGPTLSAIKTTLVTTRFPALPVRFP
jgi:hypothetical protein